jgi:hypothetical protein
LLLGAQYPHSTIQRRIDICTIVEENLNKLHGSNPYDGFKGDSEGRNAKTVRHESDVR